MRLVTARNRVTADLSHVYFYSASALKKSQLNRHVIPLLFHTNRSATYCEKPPNRGFGRTTHDATGRKNAHSEKSNSKLSMIVQDSNLQLPHLIKCFQNVTSSVPPVHSIVLHPTTLSFHVLCSSFYINET